MTARQFVNLAIVLNSRARRQHRGHGRAFVTIMLWGEWTVVGVVPMQMEMVG